MLALPVSEIAARYQAGQTLAQLMRRYDCSKNAICRCVHQGGAACRSPGQRKKVKHQDEFVTAYLEGKTYKQIGRMFRVKPATVRRRVIESGVQRRVTKKEQTAEIVAGIDIVKLTADYQGGKYGPELAAEIGCSRATVNKRLKQAGIKLRLRGRRTYKLDEAFFRHITTEAQAYWLGFLMADGCVRHTKQGWRLQLLLARKDASHIEKFAAAIGTTAPIKHSRRWHTRLCGYYESSLLSVGSIQLCKDLCRLGCVPRKSTEHGTPRLPTALQRHFYRGLVDGDGCISRYRARKSYAWNFHIVGSRKCLAKFQRWLQRRLDIGPKPLRAVGRAVSFKYGGGRQVEKICRLLYDDATVYLERKHQKVQQLLARPRKWAA